MKQLLLFLLLASSLFAKLNVTVAYPYIQEITKSIAQDRVKITSLAKGNWDPHFVVPKPSLVAYLRNSDLLILNGASLEIGWLNPLVKSANNPAIQKNAKGYLDLSHYIKLQDIPKSTDRSMGHVHAEGNPHFILDPHNVIKLGKVIMLKLALLDPKNQTFYQKNYAKFKAHWQQKLKALDKKMGKCRGMMVVQYHELFNYFLRRYSIQSIDNIEPLAGVSPNPKHTLKIIQEIKSNNVKLILQDVYHEHKTSKYIAQKTGVKVVDVPHDVGAMRGTGSLDKFYDKLVGQVCR